jgi:hypothetical protein
MAVPSSATGQRQTMTASDLAATSVKTVACREVIHGFTHNPAHIGFTTTMLSTSGQEGTPEMRKQPIADDEERDDEMRGMATPAEELDQLVRWLDAPAQ